MPQFSNKTLGLSILCTLIITLSAYQYWCYLENHPSTDNAYLNANRTAINANISGQLRSINIKNNQLVTKGTLLFEIDPRPLKIALHKSQAELELAQLSANSDNEAIKIAQASIRQVKAQHQLDKKNYARTQALLKEGKASIAEGDQISTKLSVSKAMLSASKNQYKQAVAKLGGTKTKNVRLKQALAQLEQAKLNLSYSQIRAPTDGKISQFFLRVGDMVKQGQTLFEIIEQNQWWVDANYKETQLNNIQIGQKAIITVDMYPKHPINGYVESISAGTGSAFSILPTENSAGNWVKITQRIPVKIILEKTQLPLTVGASANAEIIINN